MGVAFPAAVPLGLVGVPGSFRGCRDLLTAAELPEIQVRLGQAPAAFGAPAGQHRGGSEVAGAPGAGQLASSASRSAAAPIWCTREDESLTAAASVRMDTPSARAEGVSSSSRPAARDTRSSTRRSRRHLAVRSAIFMRTACPACAVQQSGHAGGSDDAVLTGTPTTSPTPALRQEIHEGLQVVENSNSANADIFSAKSGDLTGPDREHTAVRGTAYWITGGCQRTIATWNASSAGLPPKASRPRSWIPAVLAAGPGTISTVAGSNGTD